MMWKYASRWMLPMAAIGVASYGDTYKSKTYCFGKKVTPDTLFSSRFMNLSEDNGIVGHSVRRLLGKIRDVESARESFVMHTDRLVRIVLETAISRVSNKQLEIATPTGVKITAFDTDKPIVGISILRSGEAFMSEFGEVLPSSQTGKLLMVKHDIGAEVQVLYSKMPKNMSAAYVFLMDPMMASGDTIVKSLKILTEEYDVKQQDITVLTLISCPGAITNVQKKFPNVNIITATVDEGLDSSGWIVPGLGMFGDRYFGTN